MKIRTFDVPIPNLSATSARIVSYRLVCKYQADGSIDLNETYFGEIVDVLDEDGQPVPRLRVKDSRPVANLPAGLQQALRTVAAYGLQNPKIPSGTDTDPIPTA